jgi:acyl dehydratase
MIELSQLGTLEFPTIQYELGREKIGEYADAISDHNPLHRDAEWAKRRGYRDVVAPPTLAAVFVTRPLRAALDDPEWVKRAAIDPSKILHGGQSLRFHRPLHPGERLTITSSVAETFAKRDLTFLVLATHVEANGERVLDATTTLIIRP